LTEIADALERLRERFRARAVVELEHLRQWTAEPEAHGEDFRAVAHRLAGAAGTFGFQRLSELAARAEDALVIDAPDRLARINDLIDGLEALQNSI
jgi:HPt (histidine-containing phosphotransfer) domain-containing protein